MGGDGGEVGGRWQLAAAVAVIFSGMVQTVVVITQLATDNS
jgi:hypothetical protein